MNQPETLTKHKLILEYEGFQILGACWEVYQTLGKAFGMQCIIRVKKNEVLCVA